MSALVYADEIRAGLQCADCQKNPGLWERRGRCVGPPTHPLEDPFAVRFNVEAGDGRVLRTVAYSIDFAEMDENFIAHGSCPRALLREDLNPDGLTAALLVQDADFAGARERYPHMTAKLWELLVHLEGLQREKRQEFEAAFVRETSKPEPS